MVGKDEMNGRVNPALEADDDIPNEEVEKLKAMGGGGSGRNSTGGTGSGRNSTGGSGVQRITTGGGGGQRSTTNANPTQSQTSL